MTISYNQLITDSNLTLLKEKRTKNTDKARLIFLELVHYADVEGKIFYLNQFEEDIVVLAGLPKKSTARVRIWLDLLIDYHLIEIDEDNQCITISHFKKYLAASA